jgi:hypothetical protein
MPGNATESCFAKHLQRDDNAPVQAAWSLVSKSDNLQNRNGVLRATAAGTVKLSAAQKLHNAYARLGEHVTWCDICLDGEFCGTFDRLFAVICRLIERA